MFNFLKKESGLTLVEILAVVVILGFLIALAAPRFDSFTNNSRVGVIESDMRLIKSNLQDHYIDSPAEPLTKELIKSYLGYSVNQTTPDGADPAYFELTSKEDPWGNPYYVIVGSGTEVFFAVHSYGPDETSDLNTLGTTGDIDDDVLLLYYPQLQ